MDSKNKIKVGASVQWKWMGSLINGTVKEIYFHPVSKVIKNKTIKRNGSELNPAYLVQSEAGNLALKLQSELVFGNDVKTNKLKPKMFR